MKALTFTFCKKIEIEFSPWLFKWILTTFLWGKTHSSRSYNLPCSSNEPTLWAWLPLKTQSIEWLLQLTDQEGSFCKTGLLEWQILVYSRCLCLGFLLLRTLLHKKARLLSSSKAYNSFVSNLFLLESSLDSVSMFCENSLCSC